MHALCTHSARTLHALPSSFAADFVGILDDDTFVHVERVFADLRPHATNGRLFYGQVVTVM